MNRYAGCAIPIEQILRRMIHRRFPELVHRKTAVGFGDYDAWMVYDLDGARYSIGVDRSLQGAPRNVLEGGLAHELSHILRDSAKSPWQRKLAWRRYAASRAYRIGDERATDLLAIERGYGRQLMALMVYARGLGYTSCREHGLLLAEVSKLARHSG